MAGHENPANSSYNGGEIEALTATFRLNGGLLADKHSEGIPTTGKSTDLFGFDVTSRACCGTGLTEMSYMCKMNIPLTCSDPNKYIFWDSFHPTEKTNQLIAQHVFKIVLHTFV